jgi:hypothetical protein
VLLTLLLEHHLMPLLLLLLTSKILLLLLLLLRRCGPRASSIRALRTRGVLRLLIMVLLHSLVGCIDGVLVHAHVQEMLGTEA